MVVAFSIFFVKFLAYSIYLNFLHNQFFFKFLAYSIFCFYIDCASSNVVWCYWTWRGEKSFNHTQCWEVVKHCKRFSIIPTTPTVVLNETPLHQAQASDSPIESPMSEDSPVQKEPRPIGRKAAKRGINYTSNTSKFLEEIARQNAIRFEME